MKNELIIKSDLIEWAIQRSGKNYDDLVAKSPNILQWITGDKKPTLKQLEDFAKKTYTSLPLLLLNKPPKEQLPIADFRTFNNEDRQNITANLLDTIYDCEKKQLWYSEYCKQQQFEKNAIVGKFSIEDNYKDVANYLIDYFEFSEVCNNADLSFARDRDLIENHNILVVSSGVVASNSHRKLNIEDARGFALTDDYAPLIFINANDSINARRFTLMHELAHVAINESGISNNNHSNIAIEKWCNKVAAEILVPEEQFNNKLNNLNPVELEDDLFKIAKSFQVSTLVIIGKLLDLKYIDNTKFWQLYNIENEKIQQYLAQKTNKKTGGNFYNTQPTRVSKLLLKTIALSTLEGNTLYRDAMSLINVKKTKTFNNLINETYNWVN